ncbi:MAG: hypothetical protein CMD53_02870 [Gammaproteobacteria bacterium]|nr:hypothetical protein [Gammaproteobacteria bacterium]HJL96274.1 hypothetical protein [SAR86 cluster bacterium]|tara:strand:- start:4919 stop:5536 length:618 start_codon:yes stop_codon:yes gene_type:complete
MKIWASLTIIYLGFFFWYTDLGGKLDSEEVNFFLEKLQENNGDLNSEMYESIKSFMENDSGKQFLMVNNIDIDEEPEDVEGAEPGESAESLLGRYMEHMYPQLLKRACHPVFAGKAVSTAMDIVGIEGAENWDQAALMRYKSRRAFMEIVIHPDMSGKHEFKIAALEKTIAYPVETQIYLSDPRFILGLVFLVFGLSLRLREVKK